MMCVWGWALQIHQDQECWTCQWMTGHELLSKLPHSREAWLALASLPFAKEDYDLIVCKYLIPIFL